MRHSAIAVNFKEVITMFLEILNEKEKELFLSLAYDLSAADKDFSPEERELISGACREMGIEFDMDKIELSVDKVIDDINATCSEQAKKVMIFEAVRLAASDDDYDDDERQIIGEALVKFGLDSDYHDKCEQVINEASAVICKMQELVIE